MFPIRDVNPTRIRPVMTVLLIALSAAAFLLWQPVTDDAAFEEFLYERAAIACELTTGDPLTAAEIATGECRDAPGPSVFAGKSVPASVLISLFLHGGIAHLLLNMWFLWVFGNNVEEAFGTFGYLAFYLVGGVAATLGFVIFNADSTVPLIGASGAIAAVLGAYLVLFPTHRILSFFIVFFVPVPAVIFLGLWFLGQFSVADPNVAWEAHVVGFVVGVVLTIPLRTMLLRRVRALHATRPQRFATPY